MILLSSLFAVVMMFPIVPGWIGVVSNIRMRGVLNMVIEVFGIVHIMLLRSFFKSLHESIETFVELLLTNSWSIMIIIVNFGVAKTEWKSTQKTTFA